MKMYALILLLLHYFTIAAMEEKDTPSTPPRDELSITSKKIINYTIFPNKKAARALCDIGWERINLMHEDKNMCPEHIASCFDLAGYLGNISAYQDLIRFYQWGLTYAIQKPWYNQTNEENNIREIERLSRLIVHYKNIYRNAKSLDFYGSI